MSYSLQLQLTFPVVLWSRTLYPGWYFVSRISPHSPTDKKNHKLRTGKNIGLHKSNFKNIFCISFVILDFKKDLWCYGISTFKENSILMSFSHYSICAKKTQHIHDSQIPFKNTSEILDFFWSLSEFISCTNLSNVWTSIPGTCLETGSDSKKGFPRLRSTSTSKSRIWFRAVSIRYFSRFVLSNRLLASCKACKCAI